VKVAAVLKTYSEKITKQKTYGTSENTLKEDTSLKVAMKF